MIRFSQLTLSPISAGNDSFVGGAGVDWADGGAGNDTLSGLAGDDVLSGAVGNDTLFGGDGNDMLLGGAGNDSIDGGAGFDVASYETATSAVRLRLLTAIAQTTGGAGRDLLVGIEGLIGSAFDDSLTGNTLANLLDGGSGNDLLIGGLGDDTLIGGLGNDLLDGGRDSDTADYRDSVGNLAVSLAITATQNTQAAGFDRLLNIEHLIGGAGHDALTGSAIGNRLDGGLGDDTLDGGAGGDTMTGGAGNDTYVVDAVNDLAVEAAGSGTDTVIASVNFALDAHLENLVLAEVAAAIEGIGNADANMLRGNAFNNTVSGGAGDDTLWGGKGDDTLFGGSGNDVADYADATFALNLRLDTTASQSVGLFGSDVLISIETLVGGSGNDVLTGDLNGNRLVGGSGGDTLAGAAGDDTLDGGIGDDNLSGGGDNDNLLGGSGNDTLSGGAGDNTLSGGLGDDVVRYAEAVEDVSVTWIADEDAFWIVTATSTDTVTGVEKFSFAGTVLDAAFLRSVRLTSGADSETASDLGGQILGLEGNDTLDGGEGVDSLDGGAGDDVITGASDADLLIGGSGDDKIYAGIGNDTVDGGTGNDTLFMTGDFTASTVTLINDGFRIVGPSGTVTASGVETIYFGTDLTTNRLPLLASLSTATRQIKEGNADTTPVQFTVTLDRTALVAMTVDYAVTAVTTSVNGSDFAASGVLPSGVVTIAAGQRTATFSVLIAGDTGFEVPETFSVTLKNPSTGLIISQPSTSVTIENDDVRFLTSGDDVFTGASEADLVQGLFGDDLMYGTGGADLLEGGAGRDTLYGGADNDTLLGGSGSDNLYGDAGIDTASFAATTTGVDASLSKSLARSAQDGTDRLYEFENLIGGSGNDTLTGDVGTNQLSGLAGNDLLDGGAGIDTMTGGTGNDTYLIDAAGDRALEVLNEGVDRIISTVSYTLSDNIEELELAGVDLINGTGNGLDNLVIGNRRDNELLGEAGQDTLSGEAGDDALFGGIGTDRLTGGSGRDSLFGGAGNDTLAADQSDGVLDGGADTDVLELSARFISSSDVQITNVEVVTLTKADMLLNLARQTEGFTLNGYSTGDSTITGGDGVDRITGGSGQDSLTGGGGADSLFGGAGNDALIGAQADVLLNGGDDTDVLQVGANFAAVADAQLVNIEAVTLTATGISLNLSTQTEGFTLEGFATGASTIFGGGGADTLVGGSGADSLSGGEGIDSLLGGLGNDTLIGSQADALFNGGDGTDVLQVGASFAVSDVKLINVEVVTLTATGFTLDLSTQTEGFTLNGFSTGASTLIGGAGADSLVGGTGADSLSGGDGTDTLVGAQGDALLDGGAGSDVLQIGASFTNGADAQLLNIEVVTLTATGLSLDLSNQTEGFTLNGFVTGASTIIGGNGVDRITGGTGQDSLTGGGGADSLFGGAGNDALIGAQADALLDGGDDTDVLQVGANFAAVTDAQLVNIEAVTLTATGLTLNLSTQNEGFTVNGFATGASTLIGGGGADSLVGGSGDDSLSGGEGIDSLLGGLGNDTLTGSQADAVFNGGDGLDVVQVGASFAVTDVQLVNVEVVTLTATGLTLNLSTQAEAFTVNGFATGASTLIGGAGADTISGGSGADSIQGGGGADRLTGGLGADSLLGGLGDDTLSADQGDALLDGGDGIDRINLGSSFIDDSNAQLVNVEEVNLTAINLSLNLSAQTEGFTLNGFATGTSTITGGAGADTIVGGSANDTLSGGDGADSFVFKFLPGVDVLLDTGVDVLLDFTSGVDDVRLDRSVMTTLGAAGDLNSAAFHAADDAVGGTNAAHRVVYNTATGALYFDDDGNGTAVQIALLQGMPTLLYSDVVIF